MAFPSIKNRLTANLRRAGDKSFCMILTDSGCHAFLYEPVVPEEALRTFRYILLWIITPVSADQHIHRHLQQIA